MNKNITDFLKDPLSAGRLKLFESVLVFVGSVFVNTCFQLTSFSAAVRWFLKYSGEENVAERLSEILSLNNTPVGLRIAFGLLMSLFAFVFLLIAAYWDEQSKNFAILFKRACSFMLAPTLLVLSATVIMNFSLTLGVLFGVAAAISCVASIVCSGRKANRNAFLIIAVATAFFMVTVVLLTRNHFVTMLSLI